MMMMSTTTLAASLRATVCPSTTTWRSSRGGSAVSSVVPCAHRRNQPFLPSFAQQSARLRASNLAGGDDGRRDAPGAGALNIGGLNWDDQGDERWDEEQRTGRRVGVEGEAAKAPETDADLIEGWIVSEFNVDVTIDIEEEENSLTVPSRTKTTLQSMGLAALVASGELETLAKTLEQDATALLMYMGQFGGDLPAYSGGARDIAEWELSVVLIDDAGIRELNHEHRGFDKPTDVLSFPQLPDPSIRSAINVWLLGDVIISVETAMRQANERNTALIDELRVLLVHGVLHIFGYDHEPSDAAGVMMGQKEWEIMEYMGWKGRGLIELAGSFKATHAVPPDDITTARASTAAEVADVPQPGSNGGNDASGDIGAVERAQDVLSEKGRAKEVKLVALDLDGTLLDSKQSVRPATVAAIREAMARGVRFMAATGKARPAALEVLARAGLTTVDGDGDGDGAGTSDAAVVDSGIVGLRQPGIFLQGLAVYDATGKLLPGPCLDPDIVVEAFLYSLETDVPLVGFCGDTTITMRKHPLIDELHEKYSEPKAQILGGVDDLFTTPPVLKLIFLHESPAYVRDALRPLWQEKVEGKDADLMQAIDHMLEIVPRGVNKAQALRRIVGTLDPPVAMENVMAVGDGENDVEMLQSAGIGVAMGNASVLAVDAASHIVSDNDHDGVADAVNRFILNRAT